MNIMITTMKTDDVTKYRGKIVRLSMRLVPEALKMDAFNGDNDKYARIEEETVNDYLNHYDADYDENGIILLAIDKDDDELAGFAIVKQQDDWNTGDNGCIVRKIVVDSDYEGKGIGTCLLSEAERIAGIHNARFLYIEHFANNMRASGVYTHYGFKPYVITLAKKLK